MDFRATYKQGDYINFFRNYLLPEDFDDHSEDVLLGFKPQFINKAVKIGEVPSLELNIYEVRHPSENDPRVSLSRDAFRFLAQYGVKRALIIFTLENSANFRLSLVTIDLKWEEGKRVQKEYSNPRRYSFFLGPETKTHTPEEYLIKQGRVKDFDDLKSRFSIEVVNKDFYTQIAVLFTQLAGGKRTIGRKAIDAGRGLLNLPSTVDDILHKEFSVRLIGRLVFCWFLKKKRSDKNIPLLPEELLSAKAVPENKGYYHGILEPLFFEVLNTPADSREKKYQSAPWSQIPFLNGGLFTPHDHDFYEQGSSGISKHVNTLKVPDGWINELFEIFETYNFTIDENTSVDVELSIEPEMLGRIFENLLAEINPETGETARKATGSYYTPRPIVEYMVDESLKQYLLTKAKLDESKIRSLLTYEDLAVKLTESEKESVLIALDAVKVIDPACGSGAFPMGILQKMLLILQKVDPESEWWLDKMLSRIGNKALEKKLKVENVNYIHKLGIIQNAIFGVDIQPIAVEISKLRFFLSLIVDEKVNDAKENRGIEPLPNLEFKFVCTNSLIGLPKQGKSPDQLFETEDTQSINELKDFRDEYLRCYGIEKEKIQIKFLKTQKKMVDFYWQRVLRPQADLHGNKREVKKQEEPEFTRMLSSWDPFSDETAGWFDSEWMFGIKDGFDIVIANPPYVNISNLNKIDRETYKKLFLVTKNKVDLYAFFIEAGSRFLKNQGILTYIIPHTWKATTSFSRLRELIFKNFELQKIAELSCGVFDATVKPVVIVLQKHKINSYSIVVLDDKFRCINTINSNEVTNNLDFRIDTISSQHDKQIFKTIEKNSVSLDKICKFTRGIKTSNDEKFIKIEAISSDCKKVIRGRDIGKYCYQWNGKFIWYRPDLMRKKVGCLPHSKELFEVPEKLILQRVSKGLRGCFDSKQVYALDTCLVSDVSTLDKKSSLKFILALLNSALINFWYCKKFVLPTVSGYELHQVPVKNTSVEQKTFITIVDKIIALVNENDYFNNKNKQAKVKEYERQIDQMVYELYGLTKKEIEIVEKSIKGK